MIFPFSIECGVFIFQSHLADYTQAPIIGSQNLCD